MPSRYAIPAAHTAEPAVGADDAEPAHPVEEPGAAAGETGPRAAVGVAGPSPPGRVESFCDMLPSWRSRSTAVSGEPLSAP